MCIRDSTDERAVALRAVTSTDAMTADWAHLPYEFLGKVSNDIINKVKGVNLSLIHISVGIYNQLPFRQEFVHHACGGFHVSSGIVAQVDNQALSLIHIYLSMWMT